MFPRAMDFKSCRAHRNSLKEFCLVSLVHGDSSGTGSASPVVEMEAVAEGSCKGP